jgi:LmbE family N-acetylglucosaminyl deacetylase
VRILVIAPHPDDEVIGPGGTLILHARQRDRVVAVFLTSGELGLKHLPREQAWAKREAEARTAARILGLADVAFLRQPDWMVSDHRATATRLLRSCLREARPDRVYLPHPDDAHPDHQTALRVVRAALRGWRGCRPELLGYEVWTPLARYDHVRDVSVVMPVKLRALRAHRSQLETFDYSAAVRGLNAFRGALAGKCRYAEVFTCL